jgi:pyruvate dehydrogenase E2 component (dihydrolipoamide acetyltransferase)
MATKIFLPRLGESITEAVIGRWLKQPGDSVLRGEVIAELETAKAMMELESPAKGTLLAIFPKPGDTVHLEELIAVVGAPGEDWESSEKHQAVKSDAETTKLEQKKEYKSSVMREKESRLRISPNAKRIAKELGINQEQISQIAKEGRITAQDIESLNPVAEVSNPEFIPFVKIPLNQIQTITARRMQQSMQTIPQFSVSIDVNAEGLIRFIDEGMASGKPRLTITAILIWKVAKALLKHPRLNSRFDKDSVLQFQEINIAVAVAAKEGLFVPVIHQANQLSIEEISHELAQVSSRAKNRRLEVKDTQGATFTISNLGMKGISSFIPLVDPGQTAILGVGALRDGFSWDDNSKIHRSQVFTLTLSADHRVAGGAEASDFLATIKQLIELL